MKIEKEKTNKSQEAIAVGDQVPLRVAQVTERDRHVCALLAEARWLTTEQLRRLMTPGRHEKRLYRRLQKLSAPATSGWRPLVRYEDWFTSSGRERVWAVTEAGAAEALSVGGSHFEARRNAFEPATFAHHAGLTEIFVQLLEAPLAAPLERAKKTGKVRQLGTVYARARHSAWRWKVMGSDVALPWKEYEQGAGLKDKIIRPDAVLEMVEQRRRLFIEFETGSHSVQPISRDKDGATVQKLRRYETYVTGFADAASRRTWYQQHFADGFVPELLFVVVNEGRAATVRAALTPSIAASATPRLRARALTVEQLVAELLPQVADVRSPPADAPTGKVHVAAPAVPPGAALLSAAEVKDIALFFTTVRSDLKSRQAASNAQRGTPPAVPDRYDAVKAIVMRLAGQGAP